jgi:hypothetical protein
VKKMKSRMIAVVLTLAVAAWLPAVAQQNPETQPSTATDSNAKQAGGTCCDHQHRDHSCCHGKDAAANGKSCCEAKDGKPMACCKEHDQGAQAARNCCAGKDDKTCAKDGKDCCFGKEGKSCCAKDAAAAGGTKGGKNCCGEGAHCPGCAHS